MIRAGSPEDVRPESGEWLFIDVGFSSKGASCGVLGGHKAASSMTFARASEHLVDAADQAGSILNLLIEAPLSVAFNSNGNPTGRTIERLGSQHRYWYEGLGCLVTTATTYLLRALVDSRAPRDIRLFEGFVSFKPKGQRSSHPGDVEVLRAVVFNRARDPGSVVAAEGLKMASADKLHSAFAAAGMDFGVPPVVRAIANSWPPTVANAIRRHRG
jgi:hypothetical protein